MTTIADVEGRTLAMEQRAKEMTDALVSQLGLACAALGVSYGFDPTEHPNTAGKITDDVVNRVTKQYDDFIAGKADPCALEDIIVHANEAFMEALGITVPNIDSLD